MRKGTVVNLKGYKFFEFIAKNNVLIILVICFIVGLSFGTFSVQSIEFVSNYSKSYLEEFISDRQNASFLSIMAGSLTSSLLILLICFASGASMFGVILVPIVIALKGFLYGSVNSVLYSNYSVKGIAFNAIIIIPSAIVFIISLLIASRESMKFSLIIAKITFPKTLPVNLYLDFRNYCVRYLIICFLVLLSAVVDGVLSCSFMSYFKL